MNALVACPLGQRHARALAALLGDGGAADAYLRHITRISGVREVIGVEDGGTLVGAALLRLGAITPAHATSDAAAHAIADAIEERASWVSIVGPEGPAGILARRLRGSDPVLVDRVQQFMHVRDVSALGPLEPRLRLAVAADVDALVPLVSRYRVEDGLSRDADQARSWVRGYVTERVARGSVYVVEEDGRIVFTGAFSFFGSHGAGLGGIYTIPEARGRGLAARATASMAQVGLERGPVVTLHVAETNAPAKRCYENAGFRPDGSFRLTFR